MGAERPRCPSGGPAGWAGAPGVPVATAHVLGGHLAHLIVLSGWVLAVLVVLAWPNRRRDEDASGRAGRSSAWVQGAAVAVGAAAVTHLAVMPAHFRESWRLGVFFAVAASPS
jgi:hypothetical protein